jgi:GNAT superfamily N-acetyltransferase
MTMVEEPARRSAINPAFQVESFAACVDELKPIHQQHWLETEEDRHDVGLAIDYDYYCKIEAMGLLFMATARDAGRIVGDYLFFIQQGRHSCNSREALLDSMFLLPDYRKGTIALRMLRFCETELARMGVNRITLACKTAHDVSVLFRRCGYVHTEVVYSKIVKGINDA